MRDKIFFCCNDYLKKETLISFTTNQRRENKILLYMKKSFYGISIISYILFIQINIKTHYYEKKLQQWLRE